MTHCTDDGVGLVYRGTELVEAVTERPGKGAYVVRREGDNVVEERIEPRRLPAASRSQPRRPMSRPLRGPAARPGRSLLGHQIVRPMS